MTTRFDNVLGSSDKSPDLRCDTSRTDFYKNSLQHEHLLERLSLLFLFVSYYSVMRHFHGILEGGSWKLPRIIIAHISICHQKQGETVSSWLVPTLAGFSLCHLSPVSCSPSCHVTSTHSKQLRGTNSEKPELWVTNGRENVRANSNERTEQAHSPG